MLLLVKLQAIAQSIIVILMSPYEVGDAISLVTTTCSKLTKNTDKRYLSYLVCYSFLVWEKRWGPNFVPHYFKMPQILWRLFTALKVTKYGVSLVRILPYSDHKKLHIWTLFMQCLLVGVFRSKKLGQKHVKKLYVFINMLLYWDQSCSDTIIVHFNPFQFSVAFHIETSQLICAANQMIVFYMKCNSGMNWVNHFFCLAKPKASELKRWWLYGNYKSINCSKLTIITLEQSAKYVQS